MEAAASSSLALCWVSVCSLGCPEEPPPLTTTPAHTPASPLPTHAGWDEPRLAVFVTRPTRSPNSSQTGSLPARSPRRGGHRHHHDDDRETRWEELVSSEKDFASLALWDQTGSTSPPQLLDPRARPLHGRVFLSVWRPRPAGGESLGRRTAHGRDRLHSPLEHSCALFRLCSLACPTRAHRRTRLLRTNSI